MWALRDTEGDAEMHRVGNVLATTGLITTVVGAAVAVAQSPSAPPDG